MSAGTLLNASVGPYRLVDFLGAGGMGEVYRAVHLNLGRVVAVKVLSAPGQAGTLLERFKNEAQIQSRLNHPNIVALLDFIELGGRPCIVMEYVDGETIDQRLRRTGPISPAEALELFRSIAGAVAYLHQCKVVHRDLKCGNIKLTLQGQIKLLDFGLAKQQATPRLTATGQVVGTPEYMSPEQLQGATVDQRTDIWALGVVLYEMVTGRMPFGGSDPISLVGRILQAEYHPASALNSEIPASIDGIIRACLRPNPADRVSTVSALLGMVQTVAARLDSPRREPKLIRIPGPATRERFRDQARAWLRVQGMKVAVGLTGLVAAIAFLTRDPGPVPPPPPEPPAPIPPAVVPPSVASAVAPIGQCGLVNPAAPGVRMVTIDVSDGPTQAYCQGELLGTTPVTIPTALDHEVSLTLKRVGFSDTTVVFTPTQNTTGFLLNLRRLDPQSLAPGPASERSPTSGSDGSSGRAAWELAAWLPFGGLFRRRSSGNGGSNAKQTNVGLAAIGAASRIEATVVSDQGCVREINEDAIGFCRPEDPSDLERKGVLLVVADGMGGHSAGEIASRLAVETVIEQYGEQNADPQAALARAIKLAHRRIRDAASEDPSKAGMGTTCTALLVRQGWAYCAHVGDSRLYLIRDGSILQMTEDDSAVFDLVKKGVIDREVARHHPDRNVIVRALGSRPEVEVADWGQPLFVTQGDRFLASSDGLHDLVTDAEICETVLTYPPETACRMLVGLARERGGHDNISVGIVAVSGEPEAQTIPLSAGIPSSGREVDGQDRADGARPSGRSHR